MNNNSILNKVRELLGMEIKLAERRLEDGQTRIEAEEFAAGFQVVIVTEDDQRIPLPEGEYKLDGDDGEILVVQEEGIIFEIKTEEVVEEEVTEEVEVKEEVVEEEKEMAEVGDWEGMEKRIQNLEDAIADLKGEVKAEDVEEVKEEEKSEEGQAPLKSRTVKEEFSEASAKPIKHNPEASTPQKKQVQFAKGKYNTTLDRVLNKLNK